MMGMTEGGVRGRERSLLVEHVGDHFDFCFGCCDLFGAAGLWATAAAEEEGHGMFVFVCFLGVCLGEESIGIDREMVGWLGGVVARLMEDVVATLAMDSTKKGKLDGYELGSGVASVTNEMLLCLLDVAVTIVHSLTTYRKYIVPK